MPRFTQVRADAFDGVQINAGILLSSFTPSTGAYSKDAILGTTTGGVSFNSNPETSDFGEDMDNVPANTWQLKRLNSYNPVLSGTFVTVNASVTKMLVGTAALDSGDVVHITPDNIISSGDFSDIWLVGDYSAKNGASNGGYIAIKVKKAYSTGGFQMQTQKDGKGQFAFEFTGHYDMTNIDEQPFEIYIHAGGNEPAWTVTNPSNVSKTAGQSATFSVTVSGNTGTPVYQWQRKIGDDDWEDVEGARSASYEIASVTTTMDGYKFRCRVAADGSSKTTDAATLSVSAGA